MAASENESTAEQAGAPAFATQSDATAVDPEVRALTAPISGDDACGPDLDAEGDSDFLNFLAGVEGVLPTTFFSQEDGKPFDRSLIDFDGQLALLKPLMARTRDLRLLTLRARILILNRDLHGFAVSLAAIAECLEKYGGAVHPRAVGDDFGMRVTTLSALDLPTVLFPLQYSPLFESRRIGKVAYRGVMIAADEAKPREGESKLAPAAYSEALSDAGPAALAPARKDLAMVRTSLARMRSAFMSNGVSLGLEALPALVNKITAFLDPAAAPQAGGDAAEGKAKSGAGGPAPRSVAEARAALEAVAEYYSTREPSSPSLPLVRQALDLVGKSFFEVMAALIPTQVATATFRLGDIEYFEVPVERLANFGGVSPVETAPAEPEPQPAEVSEPPPDTPADVDASADPAVGGDGAADPPPPADNVVDPVEVAQSAPPPADQGARTYVASSRSDALQLLSQVQQFYRRSEPSSPVPILCERAQALAESDFMGLLREILPKTALQGPETGA
jgi:type VI secretion system protein ImpA